MLGCTSTSTTFNDLWRFDLERGRWIRPLATGMSSSLCVISIVARTLLLLLIFFVYSDHSDHVNSYLLSTLSHWVLAAYCTAQPLHMVGVLASVGWREVWRPSPKVDPGAFSGQRQGWKTPKRTPWQCTASMCLAGVHCWEISLGLADQWNVIFCLSCWFILGSSCVYSLCVISE